MEYRIRAIEEKLDLDTVYDIDWRITCIDTDDENADVFSVYQVNEDGTDD